MIDGTHKRIDAIDVAAEREAEALEWMARELGIAQPKSLLDRRREARLAGASLCRYPLTASIRAHRAIERGTYKFRWNPNTAEDRARRAVRKAERAMRLAALKRIPSPYLPLPTAMKLAGVAQRTLHKAIVSGVVQKVHLGGKVHVSTAGLRKYLARKVAA